MQLSRTGYSGHGYAHQGWLTEDHKYFFHGDETDESNFRHNTKTYVWDLSSLTAPKIWTTYFASVPAIGKPPAADDIIIVILSGVLLPLLIIIRLGLLLDWQTMQLPASNPAPNHPRLCLPCVRVRTTQTTTCT